MTLNIIKLAVGVRDLDHLRELQRNRHRSFDGEMLVTVHTKRAPKRDAELLDGGSLYWVIKGEVLARQLVQAIETVIDNEGESHCLIGLDPEIVAVRPTKHRPFQGWRYLEGQAAPTDDQGTGSGDELPDHLKAELRALGLL